MTITKIASKTRQVTMTGAALELTVAADGTPQNFEQVTVVVGAPGAVDMYVGFDSGVLTTTGFLVPKGTSLALSLGFGERLWGIGASGVATVLISRF